MPAWEIIAWEGFQFFGKMTASISHELKNALAIINESAGLLEDFSLLAEKGRPIDPERLKVLAVSVMKQIQRADELVKRINRFAHSADQPQTRIDLGETLVFIVVLANRLAAMQEVRLEVTVPEKPFWVETGPFLLENLIWCVIDDLLSRGSKTIRLGLEETSGQALIRISGQPGGADLPGHEFPGPHETALLQSLQAELQIGPVDGERLIFIKASG